MTRSKRRGAIALVAGLALLLPTADAAARKLQMSGSWEMRRSRHAFIPLQFYAPTSTWPGTGGPPPTEPFPNGPVLGLGGVTATGSAPATLRVPRHRFGGEFTAKVPLAGGALVQITTRVTPDGPVETATLAPGGGPGSFTWCPGDPDCTAAGPPQGAGSRNGRVIYRAGANQFGGVMQMLLAGRGVNSFRYATSPVFMVGHSFFGYEAGTQHTGGPYAFAAVHYDPRGIVTLPTMTPATDELVYYPGPQCCGGTGSPFSPLYLPALTTTPMGLQAADATSHTGFPFTTGTVFVQQTTGTGGDDLLTAVGSDMRTALGAGNITLVAGGLSLRRSLSGSSSYASVGRVRMTLSAPIPSLSPAGVAAASALLLLAAGYALRRRG